VSEYQLALSDEEVARYRLMAEQAAESEGEQWAAAGIVEGATVADVGCGPGAVSAVIARIVGPSGKVLAVDRDPDALTQARQVADEAGVTNVEASQGSAADSGLGPASVDVVMMRHVLAHNGGHEQAIVDHLASLLRPGGTVYLVDIDGTAMRIRGEEVAETFAQMQDTYARFHAGLGNDLSVGLRLGELLEGAGMHQVVHRGTYSIFPIPPGVRPPMWAARQQMLAAGVIDETVTARWEASFGRIDRGEISATLFAPMFSAWGRKAS
jgi:SAM-dependent methyltransferase